jgi:Zn-dependent M28 family amino/carboxypeptidase
LHRSFPRTEDLDRTAAYIKTEFQKSGARISEQSFAVDDQNYQNVIASFGPETGERVVVGAHYDAYGSLPGADDNASGVAGLIELANLLGKENLKRRVDAVAYTIEEPPNFRTENMGSWKHASALKKEGAQVNAMICLEMIGYYSDREKSQSFPVPGLSLVYGNKGNFVVVAADYGNIRLTRKVKKAMVQGGSLPVHSINAPAFLPGIDFSDHLNYWQHDFPAVMITDTAFYRNRNYHSTKDTPEKLDYARLAKVVDQVETAIVQLANE